MLSMFSESMSTSAGRWSTNHLGCCGGEVRVTVEVLLGAPVSVPPGVDEHRAAGDLPVPLHRSMHPDGRATNPLNCTNQEIQPQSPSNGEQPDMPSGAGGAPIDRPPRCPRSPIHVGVRCEDGPSSTNEAAGGAVGA